MVSVPQMCSNDRFGSKADLSNALTRGQLYPQ
jgi:hypothetical protein